VRVARAAARTGGRRLVLARAAHDRGIRAAIVGDDRRAARVVLHGVGGALVARRAHAVDALALARGLRGALGRLVVRVAIAVGRAAVTARAAVAVLAVAARALVVGHARATIGLVGHAHAARAAVGTGVALDVGRAP